MGRGSSRAGGGDSTGGINPKNVKNVREMISARNAGNQAQVDDVLSVSKMLTSRYGADVATGGFDIADMTGKDSNVLGFYTVGGGITMNGKYLTNKNMDAVMDACAESGYHPSRGNKSGVYAVAAHEYGHSLTESARVKMGEQSFNVAASKIVTEARKQTGERGNIKFGEKISKYAAKNDAETIAEACADVFCNGNKRAKPQSVAIVNVLDGYLKRK